MERWEAKGSQKLCNTPGICYKNEASTDNGQSVINHTGTQNADYCLLSRDVHDTHDAKFGAPFI
eukprot:2908763-Rhodomonas_salina.2